MIAMITIMIKIMVITIIIVIIIVIMIKYYLAADALLNSLIVDGNQ